ncbi:hypothetical protein K458DRAFT_345884 [Lentithecium fluviatile CBS 122367]|uniref:Uncharacterized protein n=1 Tax=Lentithecium fluviatile CBS 122367 TaxID=1168545 RepID=A0A6G1IPU3_9PLEO|nr:hypothetical protein K458DRAFT_345884 [Lentithecium fluviatile CBS 122367]
MPITGIRVYLLADSSDLSHLVLRLDLAEAIRVLQNYTGRLFYWAQQCGSPHWLYLIGEWDSLEQSTILFPQTEFHEHLKNLMGLDLTLISEWNIGAPLCEFPLPQSDHELTGTVLSDAVYVMERHYFNPAGATEGGLNGTYECYKELVHKRLPGTRIGGGWRMDVHEQTPECILVCNWTMFDELTEISRLSINYES